MLTDDGESIIYSDALLQRDPRRVASMSDCEREASADVQSRSRDVRNEGRWRPRRKQYRRMVTRRRREMDEKSRDALSRQASSSSSVFDEMRQIKWTETQRVLGRSPYAAQTVFRLKANKAQRPQPR
ncbi:hypothetical protein PsorP6_011373 [Peronosclerospora sorghi]|uniref:Uncharacterized protein n=1 Tax=Peronosclerospora sorghi TaxID=230839 RepID=A0ACC0WJY2_9STRA|nr:hypothetical protein PsorP6_011373 [Peronosclerospora sorghi]